MFNTILSQVQAQLKVCLNRYIFSFTLKMMTIVLYRVISKGREFQSLCVHKLKPIPAVKVLLFHLGSLMIHFALDLRVFLAHNFQLIPKYTGDLDIEIWSNFPVSEKHIMRQDTEIFFETLQEQPRMIKKKKNFCELLEIQCIGLQSTFLNKGRFCNNRENDTLISKRLSEENKAKLFQLTRADFATIEKMTH